MAPLAGPVVRKKKKSAIFVFGSLWMAPLAGPVLCKKKKKKGQRENPPVEKTDIMMEENVRNMPRNAKHEKQ